MHMHVDVACVLCPFLMHICDLYPYIHIHSIYAQREMERERHVNALMLCHGRSTCGTEMYMDIYI